MLSLNLARIRTGRDGIDKVRIEQVYQPDAVAGDGDTFEIAEPVDLAFDVAKDKDRFTLEGRVRTTLELQCSRCLEAFRLPVDAEFNLRYLPKTANTGEDEREVQEDDLTTAFYDNDTIDLGQLMREQFFLSLPMKPLCRQTCKGLCPQCGTNLNRARCGCRSGWEDPRFAALKALKKES
jgi:uncharacterized protein